MTLRGHQPRSKKRTPENPFHPKQKHLLLERERKRLFTHRVTWNDLVEDYAGQHCRTLLWQYLVAGCFSLAVIGWYIVRGQQVGLAFVLGRATVLHEVRSEDTLHPLRSVPLVLVQRSKKLLQGRLEVLLGVVAVFRGLEATDSVLHLVLRRCLHFKVDELLAESLELVEILVDASR